MGMMRPTIFLQQPSRKARGVIRAPIEDGFDFSLMNGLPEGFTTLRSIGTCMGSDGSLLSVASNTPRFGYRYNATSGLYEPRGLLIEPQRTQEQRLASNPSTASWQNSGYPNSNYWAYAGSTQAFSTIAKFGANEVITVTEDTSTGAHAIGSSLGSSPASTEQQTISVFLKAGTKSKVWVSLKNGFWTNNDSHIKVDLSNGTIIGAANYTVYGIEPWGDGWYRVWISTAVTSATGFRVVAVGGLNEADNTMTGYLGSGKTFQYACPQRESASWYPTSFIANTTGAAVTRTSDQIYTSNLPLLWHQADALSVFCEYEFIGGEGSSSNQWVWQFDDGSANNRYALRSASDVFSLASTSGGTTDGAVSLGSLTSGAVERVGVRVATNNYAASRNGGALGTDTVVNLPAGITTFRLGQSVNQAHMGGYIRKIRIKPYVSSDDALIGYGK